MEVELELVKNYNFEIQRYYQNVASFNGVYFSSSSPSTDATVIVKEIRY